jgi:predicted metalloprotease with PDZ domain
VPKVKGESLGVVIVESGWGSMVPTVVIANMAPTGPAARCGMLNIGDQIISINGVSLIIRFYLSLVRSVVYGESEVKLFACKEIINRW